MPPPLAFVARDSCSGVVWVFRGHPRATSPWSSPVRLPIDHGGSHRSVFVCRGTGVVSQWTVYPWGGKYDRARGMDGLGQSRRKRGGHRGLGHPGQRSGEGSGGVGMY